MEDTTLEPLPEALAHLLKKRGMSQTDLWRSARVSAAVLSRYLSGQRGRVLNKSSLKTLEKLAAALSVAPDYFLEYRQAKVADMASRALAKGVIEPDDLAAFLEAQRELRRLGA